MPKWVADAKIKKKKEEEKKAAANKRPQSSSASRRITREQRRNQKMYGQPTKPTPRARTSTRSRSAITSEQRRNQKMYGQPTKPTPRRTTTSSTTPTTAERIAQKNGDYDRNGSARVRGAGSNRPESRIQTVRRTLDRLDKNTSEVIKKSILDTVQGHAQTIADITEMTASSKTGARAKAMKMGIDPEKDKAQMAKVERERQRTAEAARLDREKWAAEQAKRQQEWDKRVNGTSGLEKSYYSAVESGTGMLTDLAIGLGTQGGSLAAMASRTYGTTRGQAEKEGATENEDRLYSFLQAAKEVGTELMFPGVGLAKGYAGKAGLPLAERVANRLTKNMTSRTAADLTGAGVRLLGGTAEENAEELAGWGLDPLIKEFSYGRNARTRQAQNILKDESDALRSNIQSEDDARRAAAYLSSSDFLEQNKQQYIEAGLSEKQAENVAELMRDYLTASLTGDTEAMEGLEEDIASTVSGKAFSTKDWDKGELLETFASTSLLTLTTGLPGSATTAMRGSVIRDNLGSDGIRALTETVMNSEDAEDSKRGEVARNRVNAGKNLTSTQVYELAQAQEKQVAADTARVTAKNSVVEDTIRSENLVAPMIVRDDRGEIHGDSVITGRYNEQSSEAEKVMNRINEDKRLSLSESEIAIGSRAIAGFQTGAFTISDANALNYTNEATRAAFEEITGVDLGQYVVKNRDGSVNYAKTNAATKDALFTMAAENYLETARAETENFKDLTKGITAEEVSARVGSRGDAAISQALATVDPADVDKYGLMSTAAQNVYEYGRYTEDSWSDVKERLGEMYPSLSNEALRGVYESAKADKEIAENPYYNARVRSGESTSQMDMSEAGLASYGKFENLTGEDIGIKERDVLVSLAREFNINIRLMPSEYFEYTYIDRNGEEQTGYKNGWYDPKTGTMMLNGGNDAQRNLVALALHETTHHIALYAPEEYLKLSNKVMETWYKGDANAFKTAIQRRQDSYERQVKQKLSDEAALEEVIADAIGEMSADPDFISQICTEEPTLAQQIINAIKSVLRKIRAALASGNVAEEYRDAFFAQLDMWEEAQSLWLNAAKVAQQQRAQQAADEWQGEVNTQNSTRGTVLASDADINTLDLTNKEVDDDEGNPVAKFKKDGSVSFSISSYDNEGRKIYTDYLNKLVDDEELSRDEADKMLEELETIYNISKKFADTGKYAPFTAWSYADVVTDAKGKPVFSSIRKNSEYKMNIDFSTICKKRRTLDAVFREMIRRGMFEKLDLNKDESAAMVVNINNLIRKNQFEAACALCFVEARRYRQQQTAKTFTNMWNELVESMYKDKDKIAYFNFGRDEQVQDVPDGIHTMEDSQLNLSHVRAIAEELTDTGKPKQTAEAKAARLILNDPNQRKLMRVGDMMASTGFENMQIENPELMKVYNSKKGTGGAKSSFGDVQYLNEIIRSKTFDRLKAYDVSGVRIQSFSDYVPRMVFDYVQVIADLAAKKLPAHAYTKEVLFVLQFGLTGAKVNMSLVPDVVADGIAPGLDKDGNYAWNAEGTFPWEDYTDDKGRKWPGARSIQKADGYKENCGTIAVGISDKQIMKMLADPEIQMVIPYHKSSLNPIVAAMTNVDRFTNYEDFQNTKNAEGKAVKTDFAWDKKLFGLTHYTRGEKKGQLKPKEKWGNVQDLVKEYVDWCDSKNYTPKFSQFLYLKEDNDPDGDFVLDENGNKIINPGYYKMLEDFALMDNDGNFKPQGDVQMKFPTAETGIDGMSMESLIERGLSDDTELEANRAEKVGGIVDEIENMFDEGTLTEQSATSQKLAQRFSITPEMDDAYMDAVNSGNMEEAQRLVNEAAERAMPDTKFKGNWYHGTENDFTEFDFSQGGKNGHAEGFGIYITNDPEISKQYGSRLIKGFANVKRPASALESQTLTKAELRRLIKATVENEAQIMAIDDYDGDVGKAAFDTWISNYTDTYYAGSISKAIDEVIDSITSFNGNDMDIVQEIMTGMGIRTYDEASKFYDLLTETTGIDAFETKWGDDSEMADPNTPTIAVVFRSSQVKSADPVTYAEDGSVIPLSERFDPTNNDIRYSLPTQDSDGNILTDGQIEFFKNSRARDSQGRLVPVYHTTNKGGFTIFDPQRSDDFRSLFFASNWDVSQTYGEYANSRFYSYDINNIDDVRKYLDAYSPDRYFLTQEQFEQAGGWEADFVDFENLTNGEQSDIGDYLENPDGYIAVVGVPDYSPDNNSYADTWVMANTPEELVRELHNHFGWQRDNYRMGTQHGYYACYLNLENPMVIDAHGQYWNSITVGRDIREEASKAINSVSVHVDKDKDGNPKSISVSFDLDFKDEDPFSGESAWYSNSFDDSFDIDEEELPYYDSIQEYIDEQLTKIWEEYGFNEDVLTDIIENYADSDGNVDVKFAEPIYLDDMGEEIINDGEEGSFGTYNTRGWAAIAEAEGYDGVIIRNLLDIGGKSEFDGIDELSDIYIAFSSNQVKDINNENPTENPDIRYSVTDEDEAMEWLASQYELDDIPLDDEQAEEGRIRMAKSKKEFVTSRNTVWNERWLTEGKVLDAKSAKKNIRELVMGVMANSDTKSKYKTELVDKLLVDAKSAYWMMKDGKYSEAGNLLWDAAADMIEGVDFINDEMFKQYKDLRDFMRTTSFKLGEDYWSDVDFAAFRKRNFGRIKLVKGQTNIDEVYQELQERWPEWFNEDEQMTAPDQLLRIEEVLDTIQPYKIAYTSEEAEQLVGDIAADLYDIVYQGEEYKSIADTFKERYDQKTKALKERHEEALRKVREQAEDNRKKDKAKFKEYKEKQKSAKERAKHFGRITANIDWLTDRLLNETKDKNIPEGFRKSLAHMLMQFDMQTERSKKLEEKYGVAKKTLQMRELRDRLANIAKEDDTGEFRYDGYLFYLMDALAEKVDGKSIDSLDTEDLIVIDTMLKSIRHNFSNYNKIRLEEEKVAVANIGDNIIKAMAERIEKYGKRKNRTGGIGMLDKLVNEGEQTPIYLFERLDPTGNGIGAMYKELRRGEDKHIQNMDFLRKRFTSMFQEYFNKGKPGSELESWRDDSQAQTFNLANGSITLTPAQIMSLYCLSKRTQAMGHILGAGIVAAPVTQGQKLKQQLKGKDEQVNSVMITHDELLDIITKLTPEQMKLADEMQSLMNNEMAAWGNETSLEMHGIKLFREKDYFPIRSSNESLSKTADSFEAQEKIKNFGFTKPLTRNANNAIMIDDIFSVVADHCNKMSLYNSMAIPISDFMRVYNYTQRNEDGSAKTVQAAIGEAYTRKVNDYIMKFIGDVNGNTKTRSDAVNDLMNKALANYKKASIGANVRVALQQPTAIFRALMVIDPKYFAGVKVLSRAEKEEMFAHCPIALWKSWGHYDMDMGRDIEDIMMNNDWSKFDTATMGVYGALDDMTWSMIWQAVKKEIKAKHPDVKVGSNEFFALCNERASEVFDKTQVVDSIFHRSDTMRSKNTLTKMATSFMAEPTLTFNVFRDSLVKANEAWKDGNKVEAIKTFNKMGIVLTMNALAVSASAAIWDAVRGKGKDGDDDDKSFADLWFQNFMENFRDNAPYAQWNNIYFVKDIIELKDGWGTSNMALEGWATLFKGFEQFRKKLSEGSDKSWYDIYMNIIGGIGYVFGVPTKTIMRDAKAIAEKFGISVFAADGSEPAVTDSKGKLLTNFQLPGIEDGSSVDNFLNRFGINLSEDEKEAIEIENKTNDIAKKYEDLSGEEKDKKVWSSVTSFAKDKNADKGMADLVAEADYSTINKYKQMYVDAGGNEEYFNERIFDLSKKAIKKTIKYDQSDAELSQQEAIKDYLLNNGMDEAELSDIVYKSDVAKDMKVAFRLNDKNLMMESLEPLVNAGLSYDDLCRLWENRNRMQISSYKGRYKDKLKSTGNFIWPTDGVITSHFGYRNAPTAGASSNHPAIDIGAPQGTAVVAADGGTVIYTGTNGGYGNSVGIKHDNGMVTYYNHLYSWNVKEGDTVAQGQQIAQVGSTGISTGPHLDFKILDINGNPVDPEKYLH